jgi:hypothetical protein
MFTFFRLWLVLLSFLALLVIFFLICRGFLSGSVRMAVTTLHVAHKLLDHEESDDSTKHPQTHRHSVAMTVRVAVVFVRVAVVFVGVGMRVGVIMRGDGVRNEVQESVSQKPSRRETQQDFEQRLVFIRAIERDSDEDQDRGTTYHKRCSKGSPPKNWIESRGGFFLGLSSRNGFSVPVAVTMTAMTVGMTVVTVSTVTVSVTVVTMSVTVMTVPMTTVTVSMSMFRFVCLLGILMCRGFIRLVRMPVSVTPYRSE